MNGRIERYVLSKRLCVAIAIGSLAGLLLTSASATAGAVRSGFDSTTFPANDDGSVGPVNLGFSANYFGNTYTQTFVNNNGNVTFGSGLSTYTPFGLTGSTVVPIIAAFFADVDTRGAGSALTAYGAGTVDSHTAFGVTWPGVGYFASHTNLLNNFQLILIDRSDTGAGNFDFEFNYNQIQWNTGDASSGSGGLGGSPAAVGYSNGSGVAGTNFELAGSHVNGAFLDSGPAGTSLIHNSLNSGVLGRYDFSVRNGVVIVGTPEPATFAAAGLGVVAFALTMRRRRSR
jgi:hypothetical protein